MFQTKFVENQKPHFIFDNSPPPPENRGVYETAWKNIVKPDRPQMKTWRMRIAFWITNAKDIHSGYVIVIGFLRQHWFSERFLMLCVYVQYIAFLV
jgi:hypothetical protein